MGYHRAGFDVVGVDLAAQPHYPFPFVRGYWSEAIPDSFDVIHASPPCQAYSKLVAMHPSRRYPDLIGPVREWLAASGKPWVMENVEGAPLSHAPDLFGGFGVALCGSSFDLGARGMELRRHRWFESSVPLRSMPCRHRLRTIGVYGHGGHRGKHRMAHAAEAREAMGMNWTSRDEMTQAIPPAYTEFIGAQLIAAL